MPLIDTHAYIYIYTLSLLNAWRSHTYSLAWYSGGGWRLWPEPKTSVPNDGCSKALPSRCPERQKYTIYIIPSEIISSITCTWFLGILLLCVCQSWSALIMSIIWNTIAIIEVHTHWPLDATKLFSSNQDSHSQKISMLILHFAMGKEHQS